MNLPSKNAISKGLSDLVGVDVSSTAVKVVRLRKHRSGFSLAGLDVLPPVDFGKQCRRVDLPRNLCSYHACLTSSSKDAVIRLITAPLQNDVLQLPEKKIRELLNVDEKYRVSATLVERGKGRQDSSFLAAAIPETDAKFLLNMFPSGPPAPVSIEVSGLSFITAFLNSKGSACADELVCLVECGNNVSYFAFINGGSIALVGKYGFGGRMLREKIIQELGVDDELADTILSDQSINVSATTLDVMTPFLRQLSISKDFMERNQKKKVSKIYASGGTTMLPYWHDIVRQSLQVESLSWNPFGNIDMGSDLFPSNLRGQETRFAAAIGAAIGGLAES